MDQLACPCGLGEDYESCCGRLFDTTGTVQFRATYLQHGQRGVLAETSRFTRHDGHWTYLGPIG